ncbi:NAD-dependent epimerase/dehydratase family protein [Nonomuraea angiospora]|uniref:SDR family oxidoreductase n=1 Tax=Nonomuraea angiospora TaxID=46172 RepID=UPI00343ABA1E
MKIVVIGGTGLIGSKLVTKLGEHGHEAVAAAPNTGVNTLTGEGLAEVLAGAQVVVDVSNSPSFERAAVLKFFETSTGNLLAAEAAAGVGHHVAVSIVGTERMPEKRLLRGEDRSGAADREVGHPVLAGALDPVLRVRPRHRRRGHGGRQGAHRARAVPADRG